MNKKRKEYSLQDILHHAFILYAVIPVVIIGVIFSLMTGIKSYRSNLRIVNNMLNILSASYKYINEIDSEAFDNIFADMDLASDSYVLITNSQNDVIFTTDEDIYVAQTFKDSANNKFIWRQQRLLFVIQASDRNDTFKIYYVASFWELFNGFFHQMHIFFALILLYSVFAHFSLKRIKKELSQDFDPIVSTLDNYVAGEHSDPIDLSNFRIEELAHIATKINSMMDNVEYHIENEYKLTLEQQKAEYRALQAEINPHFLYNTLNVFTALNRIGDRDSLDKAIISLSKLFRYTCSSSIDSNTTLEKEFKFIENYFYLQKLRFEERLNYVINMDPLTSDIAIPKLIIQPLVENCIKHGLEPAEISMTIEISSSLVDTPSMGRILVISIVNDGVPFIRRETPGTDGGVGLSNVETRLRAYNPYSFIVIDGGINKKTQFHIIIPR